MKKRLLALSILIMLLPIPLHCGIFSGYDFTFGFSAGSSTIGTFDSQKMGIDLTGYGYLGDMTSGIFLRLGVQTPYTTLLRLFESAGEKDHSPTASADVLPMDDTLEFKVLFAFGPAFRRKVSPTLSWYMGSGIKVEQDRKIMPSRTDENGKSFSTTANSVAFDLDMGFRLAAHKHTTLRIGFYLTRPLFILTEESGEGGKSDFTFRQNLFAPRHRGLPFDISGYISLGHTYTSGRHVDVWSYSITGTAYNTGKITRSN